MEYNEIQAALCNALIPHDLNQSLRQKLTEKIEVPVMGNSNGKGIHSTACISSNHNHAYQYNIMTAQT